jgi:ATP phosphoribosyltransferase regulatory subunit
MMSEQWHLPDHISDILPTEARHLELFRRQLLDVYRTYGYELVQPPLIEFLDSLLTGTAQDLRLKTFKLVDQISGKTMGVRADMTPQIARLDAHLLNRGGVTRLCYSGSVLHTQPSSPQASREVMQIGAELYGHAGIEADCEILGLLIASLQQLHVTTPLIELGHVGLLTPIIALDPWLQQHETTIFTLLQTKNKADFAHLITQAPVATRPALQALFQLMDMYGRYDGDVLVRIEHWLAQVKQVLETYQQGQASQLTELNTALNAAWSELRAVALHAVEILQLPAQQLMLDLSNLHGYQYHSGISYCAYVHGSPNIMARGGRYDHVGKQFGRNRPATGFTLDLRSLIGFVSPMPRTPAILAPWQHPTDRGLTQQLIARVAQLRREGQVVIQKNAPVCLSDIAQLDPRLIEDDEFLIDRCLVCDASVSISDSASSSVGVHAWQIVEIQNP